MSNEGPPSLKRKADPNAFQPLPKKAQQNPVPAPKLEVVSDAEIARMGDTPFLLLIPLDLKATIVNRNVREAYRAMREKSEFVIDAKGYSKAVRVYFQRSEKGRAEVVRLERKRFIEGFRPAFQY